MIWWILFAVFLYFLCAVLIVAEVFVPSGGLISVAALACLAGGIAIFFDFSTTAGWVGVGIAAVMIPADVFTAFRLLPKTRFGRNVTLAPPERPQGDAIPDTPELKELVGSVGVVITPLRPVGMCDFSGRRVECVAESGYVDKAMKVKVISVRSTQVTVRVMEDS